MEKARNFRNYKVWQDAVEYSTKIYQQTDKMPWFEKKGLCDQLQRAAVSISSNIAEGSAKPSDVEFAHYLDLQAAFPESKGFSVSNLRYMRQWYYFYTSPEALEKLPQLSGKLQDIKKQEDIKHQQLVGEIGDTKLSQVGREIDDPKLQQAVGELSEGVPFPVTFALVPWGHHIEIMAKSKSIDEALFYIQ